MRWASRAMAVLVSIGAFVFGAAPANAAGTGATIEGSPPVAMTGAAYSFQFTVGGSPAPVVYIPEGSPPLPPGLTLSDSGLLAGTPTQQGQFIFEVGARNSEGFEQQGVEMSVHGPASVTGPLTPYVSAGAQFHIDSYQLTGLPAPTASLSDDAPPWLVIDPATAALSGTAPTAGGNFAFTLLAANGVGPAGTLPVTITVGEEAGISGDPPSAVLGQPYSFQFTVTGWPTPTVVVQGGSVMLPPGLHLSRSGLLSGTPTASGQFMFNLHADNAAGLGQHEVVMTVQAGDDEQEPSPHPNPQPPSNVPPIAPPTDPSSSMPEQSSVSPTGSVEALAMTGAALHPGVVWSGVGILMLGSTLLCLHRWTRRRT